MRLRKCAVLTEDEILQIHEASLKILAQVGIAIFSLEVLKLLDDAGAQVNYTNNLVKISKNMIEEALVSIPRKITLYNTRSKQLAFTLGDGITYAVAGHDAPYWYEPETGKRRKIVKKDVEDFTRIADALENVDAIGAAGMPQDVLPKGSLIHGVGAVYKNTEKPLYFSPDELEVTKTIFDISRVVGGNNDLSKAPILICQLSPTAPLSWVKGAVESLVETARCGVPCSILPEPITGVSAPMTLAGHLVMHNVEVLSGILITQIVRKRSPVIYAGGWTTFEMRESTALSASPEACLLRLAGPQIAQFYKIPCHSIGFDSESLSIDAQYGWEKAITGFTPLLAGVDLMVDLGVSESFLSASNEQLIIDHEILGSFKRLIKGIEVNPETIASDLIKKVGPRGNFLQEEHTLTYLKQSRYYWQPEISNRCSRYIWNSRGNPDMIKKAKERAEEILRSHQPKKLDEDKQKEIRCIIEEFDSREIEEHSSV